jgi:hypothetical protein
MPLLDLDLVKNHLRVGDTDSDIVISAYQSAAETIIAQYLDRDIYAPGDSPTSTDQYALELNAPITAAILLYTGDLFFSRETEDTDFQRRPVAGFPAVLPRQVRALLAPYRVWRTVSEGCQSNDWCVGPF